MRVSLSVQISLKGQPDNHPGGEGFTIGRDEPVSLHVMMFKVIHRVAFYYALFSTAGEVNESLDHIAEFCSQVRFEERGET